MRDDRARSSGSVVVVGALPPPVHGMALVTARIVRLLSTRATVRVADTSPGSLRRGARYHALRVARIFRALYVIAVGASKGGRTLYLPSDAGWGILYCTAMLAIARTLGLRRVVHHHNYSYVARTDRRMAALTRAAGPAAVHVLLSASMREEFLRRYPAVRRAIVASNTHLVEPPATRVPGRPDRVDIGHLGNLTVEKGLDAVIELGRRLRAEGLPSRLVLAGPVATRKDDEVVRQALQGLDGILDYRGPVRDAEKSRFFDDVDVFVFPSRLEEGQPLVLLEAIAHGVPVIAYDRGPIREMLLDRGGVLVPLQSDFVAASIGCVRGWIADPRLLRRASLAAAARFVELARQGQGDADRLVRVIVGDENPDPRGSTGAD